MKGQLPSWKHLHFTKSWQIHSLKVHIKKIKGKETHFDRLTHGLKVFLWGNFCLNNPYVPWTVIHVAPIHPRVQVPMSFACLDSSPHYVPYHHQVAIVGYFGGGRVWFTDQEAVWCLHPGEQDCYTGCLVFIIKRGLKMPPQICLNMLIKNVSSLFPS